MRTITIAAYTLLVIGVFVYAFFRSQVFLFGPMLEVEYPKPHEKVPQVFTLVGHVSNITYLSVNDRRIFPDENGLFEQDLALPAGYTIVELYAHNRQKRERIIHLPLYVQSSYDTN